MMGEPKIPTNPSIQIEKPDTENKLEGGAELLRFMEEISRQAGAELMRRRGRISGERTKKDEFDIVTDSDFASEKIIKDAILSRYPKHGIVSEESDPHQLNAEYVWYIDPLDGTRNYAHGNPNFGTIIGLVHEGLVKYGAVYLPVSDEFCCAEYGKGALLNGKQVSSQDHVTWQGRNGLGPSRESPANTAIRERLAVLAGKESPLESFGSTAAATLQLADGRKDYYFILKSGHAWDYAGTSLILREVGYTVTDVDGGKFDPNKRGGIVVASPSLHPELLQIIQDALKA